MKRDQMPALPYKRLIKHWEKTNHNIKFGPVHEETVVALEQRYEIEIPEDFRTYLLNCCPDPEHDEMDENYVTWWPLHRIKNIPEECMHRIKLREIAVDSEMYLFFADHLLWCWAWAICCKSGENYGRIAEIGNDRFVANSFAEFVDNYINTSPNFIGGR